MNEERVLTGSLPVSIVGLKASRAGSNIGFGNDVLVGRVETCETDEDLPLLIVSELVVSRAGADGFAFVSDRGRRKDIVLDRLIVGLSSFVAASTGVSGFLTSGSLYSTFPSLSEAKYSSPRPKTT